MFEKADQYFKMFKSLRCTVIILEGTIGVGKTTAGTSMEKLLNSIGLKCKFYKEYVNENFLLQYIDQMEKYSYTYEVMMMTRRINTYNEAKNFANSGGIAIIDRSIIGDYAFGVLQRNRNFISEKEWALFLDLIESEKLPEPDCILFFDCTPESAIARVQKRHSDAEKKYSLEYFYKLKDAYDEALEVVVDQKGIHDTVPHIRMNWELEKETVKNTDITSSGRVVSKELTVSQSKAHEANHLLNEDDTVDILLRITECMMGSVRASIDIHNQNKTDNTSILATLGDVLDARMEIPSQPVEGYNEDFWKKRHQKPVMKPNNDLGVKVKLSEYSTFWPKTDTTPEISTGRGIPQRNVLNTVDEIEINYNNPCSEMDPSDNYLTKNINFGDNLV